MFKKHVKQLFLLIPILTSFFLPQYAVAIPAFPGAEGFGADTIGGRGGRVIKVTNLNDSGPGSFRAAVETYPRNYPNGNWHSETDEEYKTRIEAEGHRIIIFEVSGIINLKTDLHINRAYLTIAGETSPGGILVAGRQTTLNTHDIIMRHMRFRVGSHRISEGADPETLDSFDIWGKYWGTTEAYNIIIDHCSFSWGVDETFTVSGGVTNTTIQWCIISEGLAHAGHPKGEHSKGLMVSAKYEQPNSISIHHNYIAHVEDRAPLIEGMTGAQMHCDVVNNVSYNFNVPPLLYVLGDTAVNWVQNYAKQGLNSTGGPCYPNTIFDDGDGLNPHAVLYNYGNIGPKRSKQTDPQWAVGWFYWADKLADKNWGSKIHYNYPAITTQEMSNSVANCILSAVGATAPVRDNVDSRVISDFFSGTGTIKDNVTYPDDYPVFATKAPPTDSDNDGMPDSWENSHGLNPQVDDSALDKDGDGYTNIEEYLHFLSDQSYNYNELCMPSKLQATTPTIINISIN